MNNPSLGSLLTLADNRPTAQPFEMNFNLFLEEPLTNGVESTWQPLQYVRTDPRSSGLTINTEPFHHSLWDGEFLKKSL